MSQAALSVAILLTDGRPTDENVNPPEQMATLAKRENIRIYTIGIEYGSKKKNIRV